MFLKLMDVNHFYLHCNDISIDIKISKYITIHFQLTLWKVVFWLIIQILDVFE